MNPAIEKLELTTTPNVRRELEAEAKRLHLTLSAYILYLHKRATTDGDPARLDRHVREVFGKHGDLMRKLAQ